MAISTVSSNLALARLLQQLDRLVDRRRRVAVDPFSAPLLHALFLFAMDLYSLHFQAHGPGRTGDDLHRGVDVVGVQIGHLGLGDLAQLGHRHQHRRLAARLEPPFFSFAAFLQEVAGRRRLGDEGERLVGDRP